MAFKTSLFLSGSRSNLTPSASRQSAAPDREEAARFPCLATGTPAEAITMDAVVEMLKELDSSPPVPTISRTSSSFNSFSPAARMPSADAVISSMVSPFMERAVRYAVFCTSLASPLMISSITFLASS